MGTEVTATCECSVNVTIPIGGGMGNFGTRCYFPCLCEGCHDIVKVNLLATIKRCPKCRSKNLVPYDDPRLSDSPGQHTVAEWSMQDELGRDLRLTDGNYRCPKCGKLTLRFTDSGVVWD